MDRVFTPGLADADADATEHPDLAFIDEAEAGEPLEDETEDDESAEGVDPKPAG